MELTASIENAITNWNINTDFQIDEIKEKVEDIRKKINIDL
jgi:hypothetical protein